MFTVFSILIFTTIIAVIKIKRFISRNTFVRLETQKKVAILGKLPTKFLAPFNDKTFTIWTMNYHKEPLPRVDLWFDIHSKNPNPRADITRKNYPFKQAEELLGGNYFNNSVSYMIAFAILSGYRTIYLYGMKFNNDKKVRFSEYQNVRELIFFAKGLGIKVVAPVDEIMTRDYKRYGL